MKISIRNVKGCLNVSEKIVTHREKQYHKISIVPYWLIFIIILFNGTEVGKEKSK